MNKLVPVLSDSTLDDIYLTRKNNNFDNINYDSIFFPDISNNALLLINSHREKKSYNKFIIDSIKKNKKNTNIKKDNLFPLAQMGIYLFYYFMYYLFIYLSILLIIHLFIYLSYYISLYLGITIIANLGLHYSDDEEKKTEYYNNMTFLFDTLIKFKYKYNNMIGNNKSIDIFFRETNTQQKMI